MILLLLFLLFLCVSSSLGFFFFYFFTLFMYFLFLCFLFLPNPSVSLLAVSVSLFFIFGLFCSFSSLLLSVWVSLSFVSLFCFTCFFFFPCSRLVEWGIYMIGEARATLPLSNHGDKVEWLHGVAFVQSLQPESMTSLSNLHHGGKWGAWVVSG